VVHPDDDSVGQHLLRAITPRAPNEIAPEIARRIDRVCVMFEQTWSQKDRLTIETVLELESGLPQSQLFEHLLAVELELRWTPNPPPLEDYRQRFPEYDDTVVTVYNRLRQENQEQQQIRTDANTGCTTDGQPAVPSGVPGIEGYTILEEIGRGGMGIVYRAHQQRLNRHVALKVIAAGMLANESHRMRFQREGEVVASLHHPNIANVFDAGDAGGSPFIAMELLEGGTLADLKLPLKVAEAIAIVTSLADALAVTHEQGIVHRDLKPANILLCDRRTGIRLGDRTVVPKITDFGLARRLTSDKSEVGKMIGTPEYMAPEQLGEGRTPIRFSADIHALGLILYEMLTGTNPFRAESLAITFDRIRQHRPVPPSQVNTSISADVSSLCMRCLEKNPEQRVNSAAEVADALRATQPVSLPQKQPVQPRRRMLLLALAAFLFVVAGTVIRIATDQGEVVIRSADPDLMLEIRRNGIRERLISARKAADGIHVYSGTIEIVVPEADAFTVRDGKFELTRNGFHVVTIERDGIAQPTESMNATPRALLSLIDGKHNWLVVTTSDKKNIRISQPDDLPREKYTITSVQLSGIASLSSEVRDEIARIRELRYFAATYSQLTDGDIAPLESMSLLRSVDLFGSQVTNDCIPMMATLPSLDWLGVGQTKVTTKGLTRLADQERPLGLNLNGGMLEAQGAADDLNRLHQVRSLQVVYCNDSHIPVIASLDAISSLQLRGVDFSSPVFDRLAAMPNLEQLDISLSNVVDREMDASQYPSLTQLTLRYEKEGIPPIRVIPGDLESLDVTDPFEQGKSYHELAAQHPGLRVTVNGEILPSSPEVEPGE